MTYPIYEQLPATVERRRLEGVEKTRATRSIKLRAVASDILEADEPVEADAVPSGLPQRRRLRRAGTQLIPRNTNKPIMTSAAYHNLAVGHQGTH